jgi:rhodanese-related sulfurtransferase
VAAFLLADLGWYESGRRWGDQALHFLCGLSRDPDGCARKATRMFARHGVRTLLVSKFVPGLDAVAVPLTGAGGIPLLKFALFDSLGALFWSSCYATLGYLFSDQLDKVALHIARLGILLALVVAGACSFCVIGKFAHWIRFMRQFVLSRITPQELKAKLDAGDDILVIDLRVHAAAGAEAIPGAIHIDPWRPKQYNHLEIPPSKDVVLYCASPGEIISSRVALGLRKKGVVRVRPLAGGFRGWKDCGFPVTALVGIPIGPAVRA